MMARTYLRKRWVKKFYYSNYNHKLVSGCEAWASMKAQEK
jgi:hypothetical protein